MTKYLITPKNQVAFEDSAYSGRIKLIEGELYVNRQTLTSCEKPWRALLTSGEYFKFQSAAEEVAFDAMLAAWRANTLTLYRGFAGCHYGWSSLLEGRLRGEGLNDYPTYSMTDAGTCWLPSDTVDMAQGVADSCNDPFTMAKSFQEPVANSFVVSIQCGIHSGRSICWLNDGEIVIRGPLTIGEFRMHSVLWRSNGLPHWHQWPHALADLPLLPPQRPFQPGSAAEIDTWWGTCQRWVQNIEEYDPVLANLRRQARQNAATSANQGATT